MSRSLPFDYDNLSDAFEAVEDMNQNIAPDYVRHIDDEAPAAIDGDHEFMDAEERRELCERLERNAARAKDKAAKAALDSVIAKMTKIREDNAAGTLRPA